MTTKQRLRITAACLAGLVLWLSPGNAQDWAQIRTGAAATVYFKVAVPLASFREMTFLESLDKMGPLRVPNIEASSTQKEGGGIAKNLGPSLTPEQIALIKSALRNRKVAAYSVPAIPGDEAAARELFQFAKTLNVETIISSPAPECASADRQAGLGIQHQGGADQFRHERV